MKKGTTNKFDNILWIILGSIGIIFAFVGIFLYNFDLIPKDNREEAIATIIDITSNGKEHKVLIRYIVDNVEYDRYLNSYSSRYYEGKEITIYYDRNAPANIVDDTPHILSYVFGGIGIFYLIIAFVIIYIRKKREHTIQELRETGNIINAKYIGTTLNTMYSVNNRHPYNIVCEWADMNDNKVYQFKSKNIWIDPKKYIDEYDIKSFSIYVNRNNFKKYYVDIDMLLERIENLNKYK